MGTTAPNFFEYLNYSDFYGRILIQSPNEYNNLLAYFSYWYSLLLGLTSTGYSYEVLLHLKNFLGSRFVQGLICYRVLFRLART